MLMTCGRPSLVKGIIASLQHVIAARSSFPRCDLAGLHFLPISRRRVGSSWAPLPSPTVSNHQPPNTATTIVLYLKHPTLKQHPNNPFSHSATIPTSRCTKPHHPCPREHVSFSLNGHKLIRSSVNRSPRREGAVASEPLSRRSVLGWRRDGRGREGGDRSGGGGIGVGEGGR